MAHVANTEAEQLAEVPIDHLVGRRLLLLELQAHVVLLGFVPG